MQKKAAQMNVPPPTRADSNMCPRDVQMHLFTPARSVLLSPLEPRPGSIQPACSTSPPPSALSLPVLFFVYRKQLHRYLCASDLSHSSYLFFLRFTVSTAALFLQSRTTRELLARLKATKQHHSTESVLRNERRVVGPLLLIPKHVRLSSEKQC